MCRPTETYAPWFYMVLKAARVAVTILQMLANEVRIAALAHRWPGRRIPLWTSGCDATHDGVCASSVASWAAH